MTSIFGITMTLTVTLLSDNMIIWIIASSIGTLLGDNSLKIILKIFLKTLKYFQEADIDKIIEEIDDRNKRDK